MNFTPFVTVVAGAAAITLANGCLWVGNGAVDDSDLPVDSDTDPMDTDPSDTDPMDTDPSDTDPADTDPSDTDDTDASDTDGG